MIVHLVELPFEKPLITANSRMHWRTKAKLTKTLRQTAYYLVKQRQLPRARKIGFQLVWQPSTNRRRDPSNLMPTQKALLDGVVDTGLVPDDTPEYVAEYMPQIVEPRKGEKARMWLRITYTP